jgi:hypothetical protein
MSFDHKAFQFDWDRFEAELAPLIAESLETGDMDGLRQFMNRNAHECSNPYDDEPLDADWANSMEVGDAQELADFALTKYYRPQDDFGLGDAWAEIEAAMSPENRLCLLGRTFGFPAAFDPGRQGSYFQTPSELELSLKLLSESTLPAVATFCQRIHAIVASGKGLYVTF